jgi:Tol biopolymer transport system component
VRRDADADHADIYVMDEEGTRETRLTRTPQQEDGPVWSPDRKNIAFSRTQRSVYVMDADGANKTRLTGAPDPYSIFGSPPVWSPDGQKLAIITQRTPESLTSDGLSVINADGTNRTQLQTKPFTPPDKSVGYGTYATTLSYGSLVWSPTGNKLAFASYTEFDSASSADSSASASGPVEGSSGIYLINVDGTGLCKLTGSHNEESESYGMYPAWSPDGGKIAFEDKGMINVINPDGSGRKELTGTKGAQSVPVWSPDSQKIAYIESANQGLYLINADGSGREKLTGNASGLPQHAWSPDGQKIAYFCPGYGGDTSLCAINADGTERARLARDISPSGYGAYAAWGSG